MIMGDADPHLRRVAQPVVDVAYFSCTGRMRTGVKT